MQHHQIRDPIADHQQQRPSIVSMVADSEMSTTMLADGEVVTGGGGRRMSMAAAAAATGENNWVKRLGCELCLAMFNGA